MLQDKRHVFWQALLIAIIVFLLGLVMGVYLEQLRSDKLSVLIYDSEVSFYDSLLLSDVSTSLEVSSSELIDANLDFADKIYKEARILEKFDDANKLTDSAKSLHRKYDLLRTSLWLNLINLKKDYNINTVVYFYEYQTEDIDVKAKQRAFSKVLEDFKLEQGNNIVLIPIAVDSNIASLDYLLDQYEINEFPSIFINEEYFTSEIPTVEELENFLD
jgi:hypothetical protein